MTEEQAKDGLDIKGYRWTWLDAILECEKYKGSSIYWSQLRLTFLELGGAFLDGHKQ